MVFAASWIAEEIDGRCVRDRDPVATRQFLDDQGAAARREVEDRTARRIRVGLIRIAAWPYAAQDLATRHEHGSEREHDERPDRWAA
jgi:hypothetical protein